MLVPSVSEPMWFLIRWVSVLCFGVSISSDSSCSLSPLLCGSPVSEGKDLIDITSLESFSLYYTPGALHLVSPPAGVSLMTTEKVPIHECSRIPLANHFIVRFLCSPVMFASTLGFCALQSHPGSVDMGSFSWRCGLEGMGLKFWISYSVFLYNLWKASPSPQSLTPDWDIEECERSSTNVVPIRQQQAYSQSLLPVGVSTHCKDALDREDSFLELRGWVQDHVCTGCHCWTQYWGGGSCPERSLSWHLYERKEVDKCPQ